MNELVLKALDPDLAEAFKADPGPVALQTALQVQMIRLLQPKPAQVLNPDPKPVQTQGKKAGRNH